MTKLFSQLQTVTDAGVTYTVINNLAGNDDDFPFQADFVEVTNLDGANPVFFSPAGGLPAADGSRGIRVAPGETVRLVFVESPPDNTGWPDIKARCTAGLTASTRVIAGAR